MRKELKVRVYVCLVILSVGTLLTLGLLLSAWLSSEKATAAQQFVRLHVIAHSNSPQDQDLKLKVRDAILRETQEVFAAIETKEQAQEQLLNEQERIQQIAEDTIQHLGFSYPVKVQFGHFAFPDRSYGSLFLPAGLYDALRVEIGDARGENWWCVLFPPLCLGDLADDPWDLVKINRESTGKRLVFRSKFFEQVAQTTYAKAFQKWWQASAASLPSIAN